MDKQRSQAYFLFVKGPDGSVIHKGMASTAMSFLDYFLWMFPMPHLSTMVHLSNVELRKHGHRETSIGELIKFFGTLVLMTRCKFSNRRELWGTDLSSPYLGQSKFGRIFSRNRFELLRKFVKFSRGNRDRETYSEEQQWALCQDFVDAINAHRKEYVKPSHFLCIDESMSRWYGLGGSWIDIGCPHYVKLDRKPEHGMEIQDIACGKSGKMLGLKLVKSSEADQTAQEADCEFSKRNSKEGTKVLVELSSPWADHERIVCADSNFASMDAAEVLISKNLRFSGVIKTATRRFPVGFFGCQSMFNKGDYVALQSYLGSGEDKKDVAALCWLDRNRRHFISTAGRLDVLSTQERVRWRQHHDGACPVEVRIQMPELIRDYFAVAGAIDAHNRIRQDSLDLEKTMEVKDWSFRMNCTLLGIVLVDGYFFISLETMEGTWLMRISSGFAWELKW